MMTEKEYDELENKRYLAERFSEFWEANLETLTDAIRGLEDYEFVKLTWQDMMNNPEDSRLSDRLVHALDDIETIARARSEYWKSIYDEADRELNSDEAIELINSEFAEEPEHDSPDYGISSDEHFDYDYVAMGMGV
ncbi:MAG: hypothetical protein IJ859_04760 [Synergistaceae bacterium]|nr:hypothetical protein [Synergistaceae bacterium]